MAELRRVVDLDDPSSAGAKGAALHWLASKDKRIPETYVLLPGDDAELESITGSFAVRSSANVEDGSDLSFAGQFLTLLDVPAGELRQAIDAVRNSATSERATTYAAGLGNKQPVEMSVLVQEMVDPIASGVVFTRNPITGLNEAVLETVAGRGDRLVGEGVTPNRWVRRWGNWLEQPASPELAASTAQMIIEEAIEIGQEFGAPADLEWVWDGTEVWWLQIRPITGIEHVAVYSNRISKEVMPGLIKPLVWSVNVPVVNRAWIALFTEAIGDNDLQPHDLAKSFAYRSYFNMAAIGDIFELLGMPRDALEVLLGLPDGPDKPSFRPSAATLRKTPRLMAFALRKGRFGRDGVKLLAPLEREYRSYDRDLGALSDGELFDSIDELMEIGTRAAYANIVVPLLANLYGSVLRKRLEKAGVDYTVVDIHDESMGDNLDPNPELDRLAATLREAGPDSAATRASLETFIDRFGHFSDSGNDFSVAPWREQPDLLLEMAASRAQSEAAVARIPWSDAAAGLSRFSRLMLGPIRIRAARYESRREQVSSLYTYGYGLFRNYFLEVGRRLEARGDLTSPNDVMYLSYDQLRALSSGSLEPALARRIISEHVDELERVADFVMPETIYGDDFIAAAAASPGDLLQGVATSRGHHRGPVKVVTGLADFGKIDEGDVLAIPFSDVGWTPLFRKAGAVIAEAGGMLSHSSIVAREYGIPCIVSVAGATQLVDGTEVTVDGYTGVVAVG